MKNFLKILGAAAILVLGVIAVNYLQFRFDRSDVEHAVQAVRATRTGGPEDLTLEEKISRQYGVPAGRIFWLSEIESKTKGMVKVQAKVPGTDDDLSWRVDLVRFNISPISDRARDLEPSSGSLSGAGSEQDKIGQ